MNYKTDEQAINAEKNMKRVANGECLYCGNPIINSPSPKRACCINNAISNKIVRGLELRHPK